MPDIAPFSPYRYDEQTHPDLGRVIAPPYDVISDDRYEQLLTRDPHNVIRLILPKGDEHRYEKAGDLLRSWVQEGVLTRDAGPAVYPYSQEFHHPQDGLVRSRSGIVVVMRLAEFVEGSVLPHERTLSGPKADRLSLMRATNGNVEPIFGMYDDPDGASSSLLQGIMRTTQTLVDAVDADEVRHRLWRVTDANVVQQFIADVRKQKVVIVDGHHRYETALTYRLETGSPVGETSPDLSPAAWIMIFLSPSSDPGLLILPTHRVVHGLENFDFEGLVSLLGDYFVVRKSTDPHEAMLALADEKRNATYYFIHRTESALVTLRDGIDPGLLASPGTPAQLAALDATILHDYVFERLIGITRAAQEEQRNIRYVKSSDEAVAASGRADVDMVVMMRAPTVAQVTSVAASGWTMPQKSTYFYPKLASGLLFNLFD